MKANRLIIAAAGAGKTTYLVENALNKKKNQILITTFTLANEEEIRKKIIQLNGFIPENITIKTWFSLLIHHGVKPYQGGIYEGSIKGMILVNERSATNYTLKNGKKIYYGEENNFEKHYFNNENKLYSDKIAKFVVKANKKSDNEVINRLSRIFSDILVDEIQDLAGYDLEIIKLLLKSQSTILMVGDPRQVTYLTHQETKYSKYKHGKIIEFINSECTTQICEIDKDSLKYSRRNNSFICEYSSKLYPDFDVCPSMQHEETEHDGIFLVRKKDVLSYLERFQPVQLRYSSKTDVNLDFKFLNFGESKGLTFDRVLIYPTKPIISWIKDNNFSLTFDSKAKFYVALTRAKYSVGIIYDFNDETYFEGLKKFETK